MKPMKPIAAFLLFTAGLFGQSVALSVSPGSVAPGGTATVTLAFTDGQTSANMAGLQWVLAPPAGLTIGSPALGAAASATAKLIQCGAGNFSSLCLEAGIGQPLNSTPIGSGVLATFPVTVAANATAGPKTLALTSVIAGNNAGAAIAIITAGTILTVTGSIYDLNGDGLVNNADVQIMVNDVLSQTCPAPAPAVGDGKCTVADLILEINAANGLIH